MQTYCLPESLYSLTLYGNASFMKPSYGIVWTKCVPTIKIQPTSSGQISSYTQGVNATGTDVTNNGYQTYESYSLQNAAPTVSWSVTGDISLTGSYNWTTQSVNPALENYAHSMVMGVSVNRYGNSNGAVIVQYAGENWEKVGDLSCTMTYAGQTQTATLPVYSWIQPPPPPPPNQHLQVITSQTYSITNCDLSYNGTAYNNTFGLDVPQCSYINVNLQIYPYYYPIVIRVQSSDYQVDQVLGPFNYALTLNYTLSMCSNVNLYITETWVDGGGGGGGGGGGELPQ